MITLAQKYEAVRLAEEADIEADQLFEDVREYKLQCHRAFIQCKEDLEATRLALRNPMQVPQKAEVLAFA